MSTPTTTRELKTPAAVNQPDIDPVETQDWVDSLIAVRDFHGAHRARFLLERLGEWAKGNDALPRGPLTTDYVNTVPASEEPAYPGDEELEERLQAALRWNAAAMVVRANTAFPGVGGHMSTYASAAQIYEVCFHHFFRGPDAPGACRRQQPPRLGQRRIGDDRLHMGMAGEIEDAVSFPVAMGRDIVGALERNRGIAQQQIGRAHV